MWKVNRQRVIIRTVGLGSTISCVISDHVPACGWPVTISTASGSGCERRTFIASICQLTEPEALWVIPSRDSYMMWVYAKGSAPFYQHYDRLCSRSSGTSESSIKLSIYKRYVAFAPLAPADPAQPPPSCWCNAHDI